jgi:hypothetical protein
MKTGYAVALSLLFFFVLLEVLTQCYWLKTGNKELVSILYFIAGIFISVIPMIKVNFPVFNYSGKYFLITLLLFGISIPFIIYSANELFITFPINYRIADMLPVIRVMVERFISGGDVYAIIPEFWGGTKPIYLPTMWIPFIPAVVFGFDMRWTCIIFILLGCILILLMSGSKRQATLQSTSILIPLALVFYALLNVDTRLLVMSQEGVVIGFYLLLIYALSTRKSFVIAIAISLCLLSRYTLAVWAVMYVIYLYFFESRKAAIQVASVSALVVSIFLLVSQGFRQIFTFLHTQDLYLKAAENPRRVEKLTPAIENNLGMAKMVDFADLNILHNLFLVCAFAVPLISILLFARFRKNLNQSLFAICSLKLSLVFFYNLLIIPALYLFYTNMFFSLGILYFYLNGNIGYIRERLT